MSSYMLRSKVIFGTHRSIWTIFNIMFTQKKSTGKQIVLHRMIADKRIAETSRLHSMSRRAE